MKFTNWQQFEAYLDELGLFRMEPGQERITRVLESLGLKRPPFALAQGVGTNGKGSSCTFLASLARSHGLVSGLHSSPHFVSVRERVRIFRPEACSGVAAQSGAEVAQNNSAGDDSDVILYGHDCHANKSAGHSVNNNARPSRAGELLSEQTWLDAANLVMEHGGETLTYFELVTTLAVTLMRGAGVDLAVMETGLGGRFDATTALDADLVFFTPIDMDHAEVLGPTLRDIARDKAGAMRRGVPVISSAQRPEVRQELEQAAKALNAPLSFVEGISILPDDLQPCRVPRLPDFAAQNNHKDHHHDHHHDDEPPAPIARVNLGLQGRHQLNNAALALQTWRALRDSSHGAGFGLLAGKSAAELAAAEFCGLTGAWLPGRMQFIEAPSSLSHPPLIIDGAHNPHGLSTLGHSLALLGVAPAVTIFSCLRDKQPENLVPHLRVLSGGLILVPQIKDHPRAMDAEELAALIGRPAVAVPDLATAIKMGTASMLERLPEAAEQSIHECRYPMLICGSLYLLAEFFALHPEYLE